MNSNYLTSSRSAFFIASLIALAGCGGGGGGGNGSPSASGGDIAAPSPEATALSGTATKGIIVNALVNIYGEDDPTTPIYTSDDRTSDSGGFAISIPGAIEIDGDLIVVELAAADDGSTTMRCDADVTAGCKFNGVSYDFGDDMPLLAGFNLRAVTSVSSENNEVEVHVNALTNLVASLAAESTLTAASIEAARIQVATLFNLDITDFTQIEGIDITNSASRDAASDVQTKVAALNSGILAQILNSTTDFNSGFSDITESLTNTVTVLSSGSVATTQIIDLISGIQEDALRVAQSLSLNAVILDLSGDLRATIERGDISVAPDESPGDGLSDIDQAKLLLSDLRDINTAFNNEELTAGFTPLENAVELAQTTFPDGDVLAQGFENMAQLGLAIGEAAEQYNLTPTITTFVTSNLQTVRIVPGVDKFNASFQAYTPTLSTVADSQVQRFEKASASATLSNAVFEQVSEDDATGGGELVFTGLIEFSASSLEITSGKLLIDEAKVQIDTAQVNAIELALEVKLINKAIDTTPESSFTGTINVSSVGLSAGDDSKDAFSNLIIYLNGELAAGGDNVGVELTLLKDEVDFVGDSFPEGTGLNSLTFLFDLRVTTSVIGIGGGNGIDFSVTGEKLSADSGTAAFEMAYDGRKIEFSTGLLDFSEDRSGAGFDGATISNQDGAVFSVSISDDEEISGTITNNGIEVGTIEDSDGVVIFRFTDGTFESL
jgi:hypothetical protein